MRQEGSVAKDKYSKFIEDQAAALKVLFHEKKIIAYLMVYYSTIDIFGHLASNRKECVNQKFKNFVKTFMSRHLKEVNEIDLWGARCAILHTGTPESSEKEARKLLYSWGPDSYGRCERAIINRKETKVFVAASIENLSESLFSGICEFTNFMYSNAPLLGRIQERIGRIYTQIDKSHS